jgi:hypothetical protein
MLTTSDGNAVVSGLLSEVSEVHLACVDPLLHVSAFVFPASNDFMGVGPAFGDADTVWLPLDPMGTSRSQPAASRSSMYTLSQMTQCWSNN